VFSGPEVRRARSAPDRLDHLVFLGASILVGLSLFLPRPMNFSPIGALGLFAGAYSQRRSSWLYPIVALSVYVLSLGEYPLLVLASVYLGFAVPAAVGAALLRGRTAAGRVAAATLLTSVLFFAISNFGSWIVYGIPRGESLGLHYALGLPLFWNTMAGDMTFVAILFGGHALVLRHAGGAREAAALS